eukprot:GHUV01032133.1.p1 GENE.GHUV01032133.1~~GHUV01032133.1.p1  ORF type:complete len:205 (+),score=17.07 GHUV01032133.1:637-1251(+)
MLMSELADAADSGYEQYFSTFPQATDCLLNWTDEEKQLLAGTSLESSGRSIQDIFTTDILPHLRTAPGLFPEACLSYESFRRAADLVQTRAFHMKADNWLTGTSQVGGRWTIILTRNDLGGILSFHVDMQQCIYFSSQPVWVEQQASLFFFTEIAPLRPMMLSGVSCYTIEFRYIYQFDGVFAEEGKQLCLINMPSTCCSTAAT